MQKDKEYIISRLFEDLDYYAPQLEFKRTSDNEYKSKYHPDGTRGSRRENQCSVYKNGIIKDFGTGQTFGLIDWFAVYFLHGVEGDYKGNFAKVREHLGLSNEEIYKNTRFLPKNNANTQRKQKESTKVYLTQNKAEFVRLFANGYYLNLKGSLYQSSLNNTLLQHLSGLFDYGILVQVLKRYVVMSNADRVLWVYVDPEYRISQFKSMRYHADGHRVKEGEDPYSTNINTAPNMAFNVSNLIEKRQKGKDETNVGILFGQQFVREGVSDVYVVESEKTAIMLKCYFMENGVEAECVAIGGKSNFSLLECIHHVKRVHYLPDLRKDVKLADLPTADDNQLADIPEPPKNDTHTMTFEDYLQLLRHRGIDAGIDMGIYRASAPYLNEDLIKKGLDIADIIEIIKTSPESPEPPKANSRPHQDRTNTEIEARANQEKNKDSFFGCGASFLADGFGDVPEIELHEHKYISDFVLGAFRRVCEPFNVSLIEAPDQTGKGLHTLFLRCYVDETDLLQWEYVYSDYWSTSETRERITRSLRSWYSECDHYFKCRSGRNECAS